MRLSKYEMSSFLMYRMVNPCNNNIIKEKFPKRIPIQTSKELEDHLKSRMLNYSAGGYSTCTEWRN